MVKPEYPMPQRERKHWKNLNGSWQFRFFGAEETREEQKFANQRGEYNQSIMVPFAWGAPLSGVERDAPGVGWYALETEATFEGRLFLCFGGVDYDCDVYVNGSHLVHHRGGYTAFETEVTDVWHTGVNRIEVRAEDWRRKDQTYGKQDYGAIQGIWQTVWLEERPAVYWDAFHFDTLLDGNVTLHFAIAGEEAGQCRIEAAFDGQTFTKALEKTTGKTEGTLCFRLENPRFWSPEDPFLYEGELRLTGPDGGTDAVTTYFGVREIRTEKAPGKDYSRILLNGKPLFLCGTLDQGYHPEGYFTAPNEEDFSGNAFRLKRLGLNMVRFHIKTEEPRRLYWMDRAGILVMQDIPCFWGEPTQAAKAAYEEEWPEIIRRDWNHPCVFSWILFNETWGLFTEVNGQKRYLPETQEWVRSVYRRAKALDPSRLVEDNSPCHGDHVETELNTWHMYLHGYRRWKEQLDRLERDTYPGGTENYITPNVQDGAPMMNSECGMVWGVEGSAGDSDLSWQYHYMLNEFHLHEKQMGFVFTEFRDVVNEFNGYYRINNSDKDWAYDALCDGMTIRDLHAPLFPAIDAPPCQTRRGGETIEVPLTLANHRDEKCSLRLRWRLWHHTLWGRRETANGTMDIWADGSPVQRLTSLQLALQEENAVCYLNLFLEDEHGIVISRNFTTFDLKAPLAENCRALPLSLWKAEGGLHWRTMAGQKLCVGGHGALCCDVPPDVLEILRQANGCEMVSELSAKRVLAKDYARENAEKPKQVNDLEFFSGYQADRGSFANSYYMTDETRYPSRVSVWVNGEKAGEIFLENDPADVRGVLSWHAQGEGDHLEEAGSYGWLYRLPISSRMLLGAVEKNKMTLCLQAEGQGGLALYGRDCGRYALDAMLRFW